MNFKNVFIWLSIIIGISFLLVVSGLFVNDKTAKCNTNDKLSNESSTCYYTVSSSITKCKNTGEKIAVINGENVCSYKPKGFLDEGLLKGLIVVLGLGWIILFIVFLTVRSKKTQSTEVGFKKDDFVDGDDTKDAWCQWYAKNYGLTLIDGKYDRKSFRRDLASEPTQKGTEWFIKFQIEVLDGDLPGIYTVATSISRGKKWILNGNASVRAVLYDEYKRARDWPIYTPGQPSERLLEQLAESNPEKALQLQEQMLEKNILNQQPEQSQPEYQPDQVQIRPPIQPYRRQSYYPRRTFGTRRY